MSLLLKDPLGLVDYSVDWRSDYLDDTDNLAHSEWRVEPVESGGVEVAADGFSTGGTTVSASGGIAGRIYRLTNHIRTVNGLEDQRSILVRVEAR